jgi:polysaccharide deacetylase family protein (PEP-CTERM system associated)
LTARAVHHFTVDVEDYFQVSALEPVVPRSNWGTLESRVVANTERVLALLADHDVRGTMFTVGWVAERFPDLVKRMAAAGHEIASHTWDHRRVTTQTPAEFRESVRRARGLLQDLSGQEVIGFRAPSYSITPVTEWALDVLLEEGYLYDSSLFPIHRPGYGFPGIDRDPHFMARAGGALFEVPPTTLRLGGVNLPAAGGAYFRLFPYGLVAAAFDQAERRGQPGTFYIHPWEVDPEQPRFRVKTTTRIRHYGGLHRTEPRLRRLLSSYRFRPIAATFEERSAALAA